MNTHTVVLNVLRELEIDTGDVGADTRLREDLEVDSTELVEIGVALERRAPVKVDTDEILALKTFGELVAYVDGALQRV